MIPERSHAKINKYWFQKLDDRWVLYSVKEVAFFPYDGEVHTRDFNGEPITFDFYKEKKIDLKSSNSEVDG